MRVVASAAYSTSACVRSGCARGEADADRPAPGVGVEDGALGAGGVEHGEDVLALVLHRERADHRVREADAAPVHEDHPREGRDALEVAREPGLVPEVLDVREAAEQDEDVDRPVADLRPGEGDAVVLGVSDGRCGHAAQYRGRRGWLPAAAALAHRLEPHDVRAEDGDEAAVRLDLDERLARELGAELLAIGLHAQLVAGAQVDDQGLGHLGSRVGLRGVSDGTRTRDHLDHNQELYQLSYAHRA